MPNSHWPREIRDGRFVEGYRLNSAGYGTNERKRDENAAPPGESAMLWMKEEKEGKSDAGRRMGQYLGTQ